jgi:hypothetical protein
MFPNKTFEVIARDVCVEGFWLRKGEALPEGLPSRSIQALLRSGSVQQTQMVERSAKMQLESPPSVNSDPGPGEVL